MIELAVDEARRLNHAYVGTEHLLLGLIREGEGIAAGVLESLGVNLDGVPRRCSGYSTQMPATLYQAAAKEPSLPNKFDAFTERARKVLTLAQEEAQRFNHNYIGTEHLLLGMLNDSVAARVLTSLGVELQSARRRGVYHWAGRPDGGGRGRPDAASQDGDRAGRGRGAPHEHHYIGTEHLLLGLVREGEGLAAGVLESLGVSLDKVRAAVLQVLSHGAASAVFTGTGWETGWEAESGPGTGPSWTGAGRLSAAELTDVARHVVRLQARKRRTTMRRSSVLNKFCWPCCAPKTPTSPACSPPWVATWPSGAPRSRPCCGQTRPPPGHKPDPPRPPSRWSSMPGRRHAGSSNPTIGPEHLLLGLVREGEPRRRPPGGPRFSLPALYIRLLQALINP